MSKDRYGFPPDEFDAVDPASRPAGAHATPPTTWSKVWPYLLVLILAPALGFAAVQALSYYRDSKEPTVASSTNTGLAGEDVTPSDDATTTGAPDESTAPAETTPPEPVVDKNVTVVVYNAASKQGLAARVADGLKGQGWTNATPENYAGSDTEPPSAVYYADEALAATAQQLATEVGVAAVEQSTSEAASGQLSVVLRSDYQE